MICENAQQNMILAQYGELPDELHFPLEQHIAGCEDCRREWKALQALDEELALAPVMEEEELSPPHRLRHLPWPPSRPESEERMRLAAAARKQLNLGLIQ